MFKWLFNWLLKLSGTKVLENVRGIMNDKRTSENISEQHAAEVVVAELTAQIEERKTQRDIIVAEQGWKVTAFIRPAFAYPLAIYYASIIFVSIFPGLGWTILALPPIMMNWSFIIITAYFGGRSIEKAVKAYTTAKYRS